MNMLRGLLGLALLASVGFLLAPRCFAQSPDDSSRAQSAEVDDGSGQLPMGPTKQNGRFERISLNPLQVVSVTLHYPAAMAGQTVLLDALDGGRVIVQGRSATVDSAGNVQFSFQAGKSPGHYRIAAHQTGSSDLLQFWVIDREHPEGNP